jgi:hypothetical protein
MPRYGIECSGLFCGTIDRNAFYSKFWPELQPDKLAAAALLSKLIMM